MGYRHYFMTANIKDCQAIENLTYKKLLGFCKLHYPESVETLEEGEINTYVNFHKILDKDCVFEFGKLYYDDTAERIYSRGKPLFLDKETQEYFRDYNPYRMGKEGLEEAIAIYRKKIIDYYKGLLVDGAEVVAPFGITFTRDDIKSIDKVHEHIKDMLYWWQSGYALNMEATTPCLTNSWLYEHEIFELVRLYKETNWDEKCLLFYGW